MKKLLCKYLGHKWTKLYVDENICVCKRCETIKFKRMKEQSELEKEIKRLQLANRILDLVFTIIGIGFLLVLYYIMKNS